MLAYLLCACTFIWVTENRIVETIAMIGFLAAITWINDNEGIASAILTAVIVTVFLEVAKLCITYRLP